jgi:hypothetical protein
MSTLTTHHERPSLREAVRWYREAPAPRWEQGKKSTFVGYLGGNVVAWIAVGLLGAMGFSALVEALAAAF